MGISAWQALSALLLMACLASFVWAMRKFFLQPFGTTLGMQVITACGILFAALHLACIILPAGVTPVRGSIAGLFYAGSLGLFWWTIRTNSVARLSAAFSPDLPVHLIKEGPYRFIRHPFYCSYLLAWCAGVIATGRWWLASTFLVMAAIYLRAAKSEEEKFSRSRLAREYERYRERTALLVPSPRKLLSAWHSE